MTVQEQQQREFENQILSIAQDLERVVSGEYDFVEEYGEDEFGEYDNYESTYGRLRKYFEDVLDVEFVIDSQLRYKGARIALALGGPGIWLDTCAGEIRGYWSGLATADLWGATLNAIDDYWAQEYEMLRGCY